MKSKWAWDLDGGLQSETDHSNIIGQIQNHHPLVIRASIGRIQNPRASPPLQGFMCFACARMSPNLSSNFTGYSRPVLPTHHLTLYYVGYGYTSLYLQKCPNKQASNSRKSLKYNRYWYSTRQRLSGQFHRESFHNLGRNTTYFCRLHLEGLDVQLLDFSDYLCTCEVFRTVERQHLRASPYIRRCYFLHCAVRFPAPNKSSSCILRIFPDSSLSMIDIMDERVVYRPQDKIYKSKSLRLRFPPSARLSISY